MRKNFVIVIIKAFYIIFLAITNLSRCSVFESMPTQQPTHSLTETESGLATATSPLAFLTGKIAFITGVMPDYHIQVMNADGSNQVDVTPPSLKYIGDLSWASDGKSIAFSAWEGDIYRIYIIKPDGSGFTRLTSGDKSDFKPSWSPDGKTIMFGSFDDEFVNINGKSVPQIYIMKSDGTDRHRFVVEKKPDDIPLTGYYRADGLIAISEFNTRFSFVNYVVDENGIVQKEYPELVTTGPVAWSPDGKWVAYSPDRRTSQCVGIEIDSFDLTEQNCLLKQSSNALIYFSGITWSSDGKHILLNSNLDGDYKIYAINSDGTGLTQIIRTSESINIGDAVWWNSMD